MNLQIVIRPDLWNAICDAYEAGNYTHAVKDGIIHLSKLLREKANEDGDGAPLVGKALEGKSPKLRINRLETDSERDAQQGLAELLRGFYKGIRNPRNHDIVTDTKSEADAILHFVSYLLDVIDRASEPFTVASFLDRVFDPLFVRSAEYAQLLAQEIPSTKALDTAIELFRQRNRDPKNPGLVIAAVADKLSEQQRDAYLEVVSSELRSVTREWEIASALRLLIPEWWPLLNKKATLRIENQLIKSMQEGEATTIEATRGRLGTWARDFLPFFARRADVFDLLTNKLVDDDEADQRYVAMFFIDTLPLLVSESWQVEACADALGYAVRKGSKFVTERLLWAIGSYPEQLQKALAETLKDLTDPERPCLYLVGGTVPFLTRKDDDLPF